MINIFMMVLFGGIMMVIVLKIIQIKIEFIKNIYKNNNNR